MGQRTVVAGRYALLSPLGRGGMGQVWEGRDERLQRPVAVKLVTAAALAGQAEPDLVRRFTREAAVTAGLDHPGVPAIYDAGECDDGLFLVMELIEGGTVSDLIAEHGPLPVPWAAGIGGQVAAVLAAAHDRGIIHRDIKPQNVMLTPDGTAKILDFGVAGVVNQRITSTGAAVGTLAYMAPEQLDSLPATPRTDLYTLGCLLYEMLSGGPVFAAPSPAVLMRKHLEQAPEPLSRDDADPGLRALVQQMLEKDPARRPADAREVYDRLLPYVQQVRPLGDIDPAAAGRSGQRLYSVLQVRLGGASIAAVVAPGHPPAWSWPGMVQAGAVQAGAVPPGMAPPAGVPLMPVPGAGMPPGPAPAALPRSALWTAGHSLWVLPALVFGLGTWLSFGYIAARHQRRSWLIYAAAYLALAVLWFTLLATSPDWGSGPTPVQVTVAMVLAVLAWPVGVAHVLWVNFSVRLPLRAQIGRDVGPAPGVGRGPGHQGSTPYPPLPSSAHR